MRMDVLTNLSAEDGEGGRQIGAIVARALPAGGVALEIGPADGSPLVRLTFSLADAQRLSAIIDAVRNGRPEEILLAED